ncbi:MAG: aspartate kinase [Saprospiraceae bacterium]|nr:aspartate kinase [Candidatus Opimibacter skivensis]
MIVYKFGGTSLANATRMKSVADLVTRDDEQKVVVLSAASGTTDTLIKLSAATAEEGELIIQGMEAQYQQYVSELFDYTDCKQAAERFLEYTFSSLREALGKSLPRDEKWFVAYGEIMSTSLFSLLLVERGISSAYLAALDFMRIQEGEPDMESIKKLLPEIMTAAGDVKIYITQGYICRNEHGQIDNLRRGGSDYSATIIGAALLADEIQIWTDIDGVHNNDPRIVKKTSRIDELSYAEAAELAYFGAKILHPLCVRPARETGVPIKLLNTLNPEAEGTIIHRENLAEKGGVKAVAAKDGIIAINIRSSHMLMAHGFLRKIFEVFEHHKTSVDMITTAEVAVSLTIDDATNLDNIVAELQDYGTITVEKGQTIICVVGAFRKEDAGIAVQVLNPLRNIPIRMISSGGSESNISVLIDSQYKQQALEALNKDLFGH